MLTPKESEPYHPNTHVHVRLVGGLVTVVPKVTLKYHK